MIEFRKSLKARILWFSLLLLAAYLTIAVCFMMGSTWVPNPQSHQGSFVLGFGAGLLAGLTAVLLYYIVCWARALSKEERLKALYIKETDERTVMIRGKTASTSFWFSVGALIVASVAAGFINETVSITLIGAVLFMTLTASLAKIILNHKY